MSQQHAELKKQGWEFPKEGGFYVAVHAERGVKLADDFEYIGAACSAAAKAQDEWDKAKDVAPEVQTAEEDLDAIDERWDRAEREETAEEYTPAPPAVSTDSLFPDAVAPLTRQMLPSKLDPAPALAVRPEGLNDDHVERIVSARREGKPMPPVDVYYDAGAGKHWVADGAHRHAAYLGDGNIPLDIALHEGTYRDALLHALTANVGHGLPRTHAGDRTAVILALLDPELGDPRNSQSDIGGFSGTSQPYVGNVTRWLSAMLPAILADENGERSDEEFDAEAGAPKGFAALVRGLPGGRADVEALHQNVLRRETARPAQKKVGAPEPKLFEEEAPAERSWGNILEHPIADAMRKLSSPLKAKLLTVNILKNGVGSLDKIESSAQERDEMTALRLFSEGYLTPLGVDLVAGVHLQMIDALSEGARRLLTGARGDAFTKTVTKSQLNFDGSKKALRELGRYRLVTDDARQEFTPAGHALSYFLENLSHAPSLLKIYREGAAELSAPAKTHTVETTGITSGGHRGDRKVVTHIPEADAQIEDAGTVDEGRERAAQIREEWDDRLIQIQREVAACDSVDKLGVRLDGVRAAMRQYDRDGYDLDDVSDYRARELKVHMDAIIAREQQLKERAKVAPLPPPPKPPLRGPLTGDPWVDNEVRITVTLLAGQHPRTKFRHAYLDIEVGEGGRVANRRAAYGEHQLALSGIVADLIAEVREQLAEDATADRYTQRCESCRTLVTVGGEDKKGRNHAGPNCPKHPDHEKKAKPPSRPEPQVTV